MAEYHVSAGLFGIYAGTLNSKNKALWQNKTECTDEALCAVRDFLKTEADTKKMSRWGYEWTMKDGKTVSLVVEIKPVALAGGDGDADKEKTVAFMPETANGRCIGDKSTP